MKVAVSSTGKNLESEVSEVFGRCPYFLIIELKNGNEKSSVTKVLDNAAAKQKGGSGVSAAQTVAAEGVEAVVAGNFGPRALDAFKQFEIAAYKGKGRVEKALSDLANGKLEDASGIVMKEKENGKEEENGKESVKEKSDAVLVGGRVKIAVPTDGFKGLKERVAEHFGRCETYTIIDENGRLMEVIRNMSEHAGGKGLPPEFLKKQNVSVLLCKDLGPRALELCKRLGIKVFVSNAVTVEKIFEAMKNGGAKKAGLEDVCEEHKS